MKREKPVKPNYWNGIPKMSGMFFTPEYLREWKTYPDLDREKRQIQKHGKLTIAR